MRERYGINVSGRSRVMGRTNDVVRTRTRADDWVAVTNITSACKLEVYRLFELEFGLACYESDFHSKDFVDDVVSVGSQFLMSAFELLSLLLTCTTIVLS
jgi:hypothetical protein